MHRPTILVADDDKCVRAGLRRHLTCLGYQVVEAEDGLAVLRECPKGQIDVILLDQGMPNGDGRSIARMIRKESDVPIIFLSGHGREDFREIVATLSDMYLLPKPANDAKLTHLLAALHVAPPVGAQV